MPFEIYLTPVVLVQSALGAAIIYQIIDYLKHKALGFQTILDGLYIQLMEYWMLEIIVLVLWVECFEDKITHWILAWIVGFGGFLVTFLSAVHLIVCLTFQILLICYQNKIEELDDRKVLKVVRSVIFNVQTFTSTINSPVFIYRISELLMVFILGTVMFSSSNIPSVVYILQEVEYERRTCTNNNLSHPDWTNLGIIICKIGIQNFCLVFFDQ